MPKEQKSSITKKVSSKAIENPWREELAAIQFNQTTLRTCDVLLMVESEETCSDVIHSCYMGYRLNLLSSVKIITYTDLKMEIIECTSSKDAAEKDKLFERACVEAIIDLDKQDGISTELLAQLIKLKILRTIAEDVKMEQEVIFLQMEREKLYKSLLEGSGGSGEGKKSKGKKEAKKTDEGKKKKGAGSDDASRITTNSPKPFSPFFKGGDHSNIQVDDKHLYIVLAGFYRPQLFNQLVKIGVPLNCLLEVSFSRQSILYSNELRQSTASESESSISQLQTVSTEDTEAESERSAISQRRGTDLQYRLEPVGPSITSFWLQVIELIHSEQQHDYLNDIFHMYYKITEYTLPDSTCELEESCNDVYEKQFEDLSNYVKEIDVLRRQYSNYLRNLKLQKVPCAPVILPPHCLRVYNKLINKFPPDCFSIALLMACLLEEVCSRVPGVPLQSDPLIRAKNLEENPLEKTADIDSNPPTETHGGIREQVVNVLDSYKKRHDAPQNVENTPRFRCYTCKHDPKIDLKIDFNTFMVHASNELQLVMNCYKNLSKELYTINMNGLKKCTAAILRSKHAVGMVLEKLMNEYNLQSWRKALGLTKDELCDAIHIFLLTKLKDKVEPQLSETELKETEQFPCVDDDMLSAKFCVCVDNASSVIDENDFTVQGQLSMGLLYRNFSSKNVSQIFYPANVGDYCYKEHLPGPVLLQELLKASLEYECYEQLYSPLTDTLLFLFHNELNEFGCASMFKKAFIRTPICVRDFCEYIRQADKEWICDQEFFYQVEYKAQVAALKRKKEDLKKSLYSEFIPDEYYFILPDSIKAKLLEKDKPPAPAKVSGKKKGGKEEKTSKSKDFGSDKKDKKKDRESLSTKKSEVQLDIEDVLKKMPEVPPRKVLSFHCAEENDPYSFIAYDLGSSQVQVNEWTNIFQSLDGLRVTVKRACWLGDLPTVSINLKSNNHNFIFHYRSDLVTKEPFTFHSVLSDGCCLAFSKPVKFQKVEDVICERICRSKNNQATYSEDNSAYERKPQEIYFVSEKQDCVIKSLKVPFSTERNLVLSENLLVPFLDSLEKFNIRAHVTVSPETLRQRQKRLHNLRHRVCSSASATKTTLSKYASRRRKKTHSSESALVEKYSPKIIVHKPFKQSTLKANDDEFLQHAYDPQEIHAIPQASEMHKRKQILQKLREAIEKHIPLFKICSSRLHKFTYVKRIKSYINVPVGNVIKRILYKPAYLKTKRTIEIKRCLPLGCVNVSKIKRPAYNIRVSLPSGLVIRDIPGVTSEYPCIRQYYIDKGPQCKDIVHEESRTFLRNGNIAIKRCDGNINVLSANGRIFHFEIPYIMKTRTERMNYRDTNVTKLQKRRSPGVPIHAARRSLTTFQKLLHKVLPRRFKHMIDSKESRYYLSRRAYLRAQKKYCTNINALYLLESQRQPFPEYTVITPDGKKIKVSKSKVYEEHKYYVATDIDFRTEETLYEREDGTCCILNRDGVLTTQFPDGTRLRTWFVESPNQVFADDIVNFQTKDEAVETDDVPDMDRSRTYTIVDFSFALNQGFVSIFMYYEYSHPNYATVTFGGEDSEMCVVLPNGSAITSKEGQRTTVTVGKYLETEFDKQKFVLKARGCDNCANSAHAVLNVGSWYHGKVPKSSDVLMYVKDCFEKVFKVDYKGKCTRNSLETTKAETECMRHTLPTFEKLFAVKSDFSGCLFWNKCDFKTRMDVTEKNENCTVDSYHSGSGGSGVVEFKKYVSKPYYERYICKYEEPTLKLSKYKTKHGKFPVNPAYILQNILHKVVSIEKVAPLYKCILENCERYGLRKKYESFETFFNHITQELPVVYKSLRKDEYECMDPCPCVTTKDKAKIQKQDADEMKQVQALHDKWYKWQQDCKKYKQLVKDNYVPLYFRSKFGSEYSVENKDDSRRYVQSLKKKHKGTEENDEIIDSEVVTGHKSSIDVLQKDDIKVEKKRSVEKKYTKPKCKEEKVVREQLRVTIPKNMVLLYNQGKGDKNLEVNESKITARSQSTGREVENRPEKMLILAGVRDSSKVEIANKFLEIHGKANKFEEGSKVVIVAEEGIPKIDTAAQTEIAIPEIRQIQYVPHSKEERRHSASTNNGTNPKLIETKNTVGNPLDTRSQRVDMEVPRSCPDIVITAPSTEEHVILCLKDPDEKVHLATTLDAEKHSHTAKVQQPQQQQQQQEKRQQQQQQQQQQIQQQQKQQQQQQRQQQTQEQQQQRQQQTQQQQRQQQQHQQPQQQQQNETRNTIKNAEDISEPKVIAAKTVSPKSCATQASAVEYKSATDILRDIVAMSKSLLETTTDEAKTDESSPDEAYSDSVKRKVMSVLSSLMKMVIEQLSKCSEDITQAVGSSITAAAYRFVCDAKLNRDEMTLLLKALKGIVDEAVANLEPCNSTSLSGSTTSVGLVDKSKLIPVKNIGDVFNSYNKNKQGIQETSRYCSSKTTSINSEETDKKRVASINDMYLNENSLNQRSTKVSSDSVDVVDDDSDVTVSYQDLDISESMIGFTSKYNFRFSDAGKLKHRAESQGVAPKDRAMSSSDFSSAVKKRKSSSIIPSHVKFEKVEKHVSGGSLQMIHQSEIMSLTSETERIRMSSFHSKTPTPSMLPLYSSSINMRQPDSTLEAVALVFDQPNSNIGTKGVKPEGRFVISEGTQTYDGKDMNIQTSNELLAD